MIWLCKAPPPQNKQRNQREFEKIKDLHQDYSKVVIARTRLQGKGEGISLTPYYHFHPLHRHVDISRAINAESSLLHIGSSRSRAGILWFPNASRSSSEKLICDKCKQTKLIWGGSANIQPLDCRILGHQRCLDLPIWSEKSVRVRSYSGPHVTAFGLNLERYSVSLLIQSECGKMWARITPNTDTFYAVNKMSSDIMNSILPSNWTWYKGQGFIS